MWRYINMTVKERRQLNVIAGHRFEQGRCSCGRTRSDIRSVVYEFRGQGKTAIGCPSIAHTGSVTESEWSEMCKMVDDEGQVFDAALEDICRT